MIASIITPEDIRSAFISLTLITGILALLPLLRLKSYSSSVNISLVVYIFVCLWAWFINSDAKSSACPEYSAYLWPLFSSLIGLIYLVAHIPFKSNSLLPIIGISVLCSSMIYLSDWKRSNDVINSYKNVEQGAVANPMGAFSVKFSHNYNLKYFVHHRSLP